jgi:integrase
MNASLALRTAFLPFRQKTGKGDYFAGHRRWIRLHEKGGKEHDVPCHHRLDECLHDYIEAAGIADDIDGYLFRSARRKTALAIAANFCSNGKPLRDQR